MRIKSIFTKQLIIYVATLFASFFLLGAVLSVVYRERYMNETKEKLINQGMEISKEYIRAYYTGNMKNLIFELQVLEDYMNASVFFIDHKGVLVMASSGIKEKWIGQTITNPEAINEVIKGNIVTLEGIMTDLFDEPVLTVGYPIDSDSVAGIFMCTSMPEIQRSLQGMYKAGFLSLFFVMTVGVVLVYLSSKKISKPLLEMNQAAKIIAGGNLEQRVKINSDDEVGQLAVSFNHMAESLDEYERVRRDFIANVSHDLRSPLTSIQGFLNAVLDGTIPPERQNHYLQIVLEESTRLSKLTNDIVELSHAQTSAITINYGRFDINKLIRNSLEKLEFQFQEKNITVQGIFEEKETFVWADDEKIQRVIQNLVENAIKFSSPNSHIEIETTLKDKWKVFIAVRDEGCGINETDQKYVFDRFYKSDTSRGLDKKGSGLGLSIVREFLLAHGENIVVKSEQGKGSEFVFSLKVLDSF